MLVIRGHIQLTQTNRYPDITLRQETGASNLRRMEKLGNENLLFLLHVLDHRDGNLQRQGNQVRDRMSWRSLIRGFIHTNTERPGRQGETYRVPVTT